MEAIHEILRLWVKAVALLRYQQGPLVRDEQPRSFLIVSGTAPFVQRAKRVRSGSVWRILPWLRLGQSVYRSMTHTNRLLSYPGP